MRRDTLTHRERREAAVLTAAILRFRRLEDLWAAVQLSESLWAAAHCTIIDKGANN
jgi:hypothetical protein